MGVSWGGELHGSKMPPDLPCILCLPWHRFTKSGWFGVVLGTVLRITVLEYVTSPGMDADTQGLASALALLGVYNVADLVELARTGSLVEMILTAVEQQDLEQRATEAVSGLRAAAEQRATHAAHTLRHEQRRRRLLAWWTLQLRRRSGCCGAGGSAHG